MNTAAAKPTDCTHVKISAMGKGSSLYVLLDCLTLLHFDRYSDVSSSWSAKRTASLRTVIDHFDLGDVPKCPLRIRLPSQGSLRAHLPLTAGTMVPHRKGEEDGVISKTILLTSLKYLPWGRDCLHRLSDCLTP